MARIRLSIPGLLIATLMLILCPAGQTQAIAAPLTGCTLAPCIDFGGLVVDGGTVSYQGGSAPLVGTDIPIPSMSGFATPEHSNVPNGTIPIVDGLLNFESGSLEGFDLVTGYHFGGGGFFTITGGIPDLDIPSDTVLLTGPMTDAIFRLGLLGFEVAPHGTDVKDRRVVEFFGLDPDAAFSFSGFIITDLAAANGGPFSATALSVDIPNHPGDTGPVPIPEPATVLLLGGGVAVAMARRKRR